MSLAFCGKQSKKLNSYYLESNLKSNNNCGKSQLFNWVRGCFQEVLNIVSWLKQRYFVSRKC